VVLACASLAAAEVGPFAPWRSVSDTNLCVQPASITFGAPLLVKPCDPRNLAQRWSWIRDGNSIYRLQNGAPSAQPMCAWVPDGGPINNEDISLDECSLSDGSGTPVSNAQFDSGTPLPNAVSLESHIHFTATNHCVDIIFGTNLITKTCNSATLTQKWLVGFV
jgi:hypothetical protein